MPGVASNTAFTELGQKQRRLAGWRPSEQQARLVDFVRVRSSG